MRTVSKEVIAVSKLGYMLETPSIRRYSSPCETVKMRPVRTISRKDRTQCSESSETNTPSACKGEDRVRAAWRHAESGRNDLAFRKSEVTTLVTVSVTPNIQDFPVWQSRQPGRREALAQEITVSGKFAEWNVNSVPRVFGGGALTTGTYAFPIDTAALEEFAVVAHVVDGSDQHRFSFGRVNQTEAAEVQFNRSQLAVLPFSFAVLAPAGGGSPGTYHTNT